MRGRVLTVITVVTLGAAGFLTAGCADGDLPDLEQLRTDVEREVAGAGDRIDEVRRAVEDAGVDEETRAEAQEVARQAGDALAEARDAVAARAEEAGPEAERAVERARSELADAERRVEEVAGEADGALRGTLDGLADQLRELADRLDQA